MKQTLQFTFEEGECIQEIEIDAFEACLVFCTGRLDGVKLAMCKFKQCNLIKDFVLQDLGYSPYRSVNYSWG